MNIARYPSSITDAQWALIKPMLPEPKKRGRPPTDRRQIIDAIFYVLMGGIQWRMLPSSFPPWQTVYHVFRQWSQDHTLEWLNARLRARVRGSEGKRSRPTAAILDSQSVKSDGHGGQVGLRRGQTNQGTITASVGGYVRDAARHVLVRPAQGTAVEQRNYWRGHWESRVCWVG